MTYSVRYSLSYHISARYFFHPLIYSVFSRCRCDVSSELLCRLKSEWLTSCFKFVFLRFTLSTACKWRHWLKGRTENRRGKKKENTKGNVLPGLSRYICATTASMFVNTAQTNHVLATCLSVKVSYFVCSQYPTDRQSFNSPLLTLCSNAIRLFTIKDSSYCTPSLAVTRFFWWAIRRLLLSYTATRLHL